MPDSDALVMYTDESSANGTTFHSSVLVSIRRWPGVLTQWLKYRAFLRSRYQVPKDYHMHMAQWIMAKDHPVPERPNEPINVSENLRQELTVKALQTMGSCCMTVFTTEYKSPQMVDAYANHLAGLEDYLASIGAWGIVVLDGPYDKAEERLESHRTLNLKTRRVVEDAWVQPARRSQLVQMADIVAHCALQASIKNGNRQFMWDWYPNYLHGLEAPDWCVCP